MVTTTERVGPTTREVLLRCPSCRKRRVVLGVRDGKGHVRPGIDPARGNFTGVRMLTCRECSAEHKVTVDEARWLNPDGNELELVVTLMDAEEWVESVIDAMLDARLGRLRAIWRDHRTMDEVQMAAAVAETLQVIGYAERSE